MVHWQRIERSPPPDILASHSHNTFYITVRRLTRRQKMSGLFLECPFSRISESATGFLVFRAWDLLIPVAYTLGWRDHRLYTSLPNDADKVKWGERNCFSKGQDWSTACPPIDCLCRGSFSCVWRRGWVKERPRQRQKDVWADIANMLKPNSVKTKLESKWRSLLQSRDTQDSKKRIGN